MRIMRKAFILGAKQDYSQRVSLAIIIGKVINRRIISRLKVSVVFLLLVVGCARPSPVLTPVPISPPTDLTPTSGRTTNTPFLPTLYPTYTPKVVITSTITPTSTSTPFDLEWFQSKVLLRTTKPQPYISNQCQYLAERWQDGNSEPGTIVVPVMYHSIRQAGKPVNDSMTVSHEYFEETMQHASQLGFETITAQQLVDFLYHNQKIPRLSMILIVDDRRLGVVRDHFMQELEKNDWTVTLAYITGVATQSEWDEMQLMNIDGRLDVQAHGFFHNGNTYFTEFTPVEIIKEEIFNPIKVIEQHTGRRPVALWSGPGCGPGLRPARSTGRPCIPPEAPASILWPASSPLPEIQGTLGDIDGPAHGVEPARQIASAVDRPGSSCVGCS